ncbi:ABC transporter ATP-binding protein, partial [Burkholderia multivorans]|uniref:ABC transporter ATP-binding protein n=1 Tax=Burkholderia multivorans TaxID=87883 RepID=UPI001E59A6E1
MSAIEIRHVKKRYKSLQALKGVSLSVEEGEFFGLLGPNGAGKTTLISILAGLARADEGSISVRGHDVVKDFRARASRSASSRRSSCSIRSSPCARRCGSSPAIRAAPQRRLDRRGDGEPRSDRKADANMRALSGGMKRRVLVAQALVHRPPVIVLDEPTAGVDVELRQTLWKFISRLNREGHTIVLTTHYLEEAQSLCDRIAMLRRGEVVALDRTDALLRRFAAAAVSALRDRRAAGRAARARDRSGRACAARASAAAVELRRCGTDSRAVLRGRLHVRRDRGPQGRPRGCVRSGDERRRGDRGTGMKQQPTQPLRALPADAAARQVAGSGFRTLF